MCGVAGIIGADRDTTVSAVRAMVQAMRHRGPDDDGEWYACDGRVGLGHTRLAVIDPSPAGHQPMVCKGTTSGSGGSLKGTGVVGIVPEAHCVISFNGEIYNFRELRAELEGLGERFHTKTDTEVILKAYGVWCIDALKRLRGIFAIGIWDARKGCLVLARDPLGVKPLYLFRTGHRLLFASEVRALLATGLVPRALDPAGLWSYLAYGSVQEPYTMVSGVRSLPPGHYLVLYSNGGRGLEAQKPVPYWRLPQAGPAHLGDEASLLGTVRTHLEDAVRSELVSDVPLGVFLSGGIDSTAVAALAKMASNGPVRTFSLVFQEARYDERRWSRLAAKHIGTEHTEVELTGDDARGLLPKALDSFDQPSTDGLNTWFVSKAAKEAGLTVALSGVGGDEIFGGYDGYRKPLLAAQASRLATRIPLGLRQVAAAVIGVVGRREPVRKLETLLLETGDSYFVTRRLFSERQIRALINPEVRASDCWEEEAFGGVLEEVQGYDAINRVSALELRTYMLSTILRDTDQMGMAHALEVRVPLIDPELVSLVMALPGRLKLGKRPPKPLLTRPLEGLIPYECVHRVKRGFELPFEEWLRGAMKEEMCDALCCGKMGQGLGVFLRSGLEGLWQDFDRRRVSWSRVWAVFVLRRWLDANGLSG